MVVYSTCSFSGEKWHRCFYANFIYTRKYPLRGYILGVLTHTNALDRLWGGDETLTHVVLNSNIHNLASTRWEYSDLVSGTLTMWF